MWVTETYVAVKVSGQGTCTDPQNVEGWRVLPPGGDGPLYKELALNHKNRNCKAKATVQLKPWVSPRKGTVRVCVCAGVSFFSCKHLKLFKFFKNNECILDF